MTGKPLYLHFSMANAAGQPRQFQYDIATNGYAGLALAEQVALAGRKFLDGMVDRNPGGYAQSDLAGTIHANDQPVDDVLRAIAQGFRAQMETLPAFVAAVKAAGVQRKLVYLGAPHGAAAYFMQANVTPTTYQVRERLAAAVGFYRYAGYDAEIYDSIATDANYKALDQWHMDQVLGRSGTRWENGWPSTTRSPATHTIVLEDFHVDSVIGHEATYGVSPLRKGYTIWHMVNTPPPGYVPKDGNPYSAASVLEWFRLRAGAAWSRGWGVMLPGNGLSAIGSWTADDVRG